MQFLDKLERKLGWLTFPGLLRYYALFHVMVFLLQFVNPQIGSILEFDREKILSGEIWRVVTFLFATNRFSSMNPVFAMLFLYIMVMIAFMISDALEGAWGVFRSTLFYYTGIAGLLAANFIYSQPVPGSGYFIYLSAFFAFATLFPKVEFMMFFIIPVQVRWIATLIAVFLVLPLFSLPFYYIGYAVLGFGNYALWAGIPALRGQAKIMESAGRRRKFEKSKANPDEAFHRCAKCGRTEGTDPSLEFRMAANGEEYCEEHLPE